MFFRSFLQRTSSKTVSGDKMLNRARGPVWHRKQQRQGIIPPGLRGLDREATWGYGPSDGWVYGHGTFCLVAHEPVVLGAFKGMPNSGHEAKRLWLETGKLRGLVETVIMDSKADDQALFREFQRQRGMLLLTAPRRHPNPTLERQQMIDVLQHPENRQRYQERSHTVEPMQGLLKEIFELERCWMRGTRNNRWLFAAMGVTVQMHQVQAWKEGRSTWAIKQDVLGL